MRNKKCRRIIEILFILLLIVPLHSLFMQEQEEAVEEVEQEVVALSHQVKVVVEKMGPVPLILNLL